MEKKYKGRIQEKKSPVKSSQSTFWESLGIWILSVVLSLLPLYVYIVDLYISSKDSNKGVLAFWLKCIVELDLLWVSATVLIMAIANAIINRSSAKNPAPKKSMWLIFGSILAFVLEVTWILFKFRIESNSPPQCAILGLVLILLSFVVSTPLQINSLKTEA